MTHFFIAETGRETRYYRNLTELVKHQRFDKEVCYKFAPGSIGRQNEHEPIDDVYKYLVEWFDNVSGTAATIWHAWPKTELYELFNTTPEEVKTLVRKIRFDGAEE